MRINTYEFPESSFLSLEKDYKLIINKIFKNQRLLKYLYYPNREAEYMEDLTQEQILGMLNKEIVIVPNVKIQNEQKQILRINFDAFVPNEENPYYRDNIISFDIICHDDSQLLQDFQLRPFKIAGEIDSMFNNKHLTGIGNLNFIGATTASLANAPDYTGFCLEYRAIHGKEDKV